ncbi:MAG: hypothetical protein WA826_18580, partial [Silvibacterium sp.]
MSAEKIADPPPPKTGAGFFRKLFSKIDEKGHPDTVSAELDLADIQGLILRGYRMPMVRHFLLEVGDPGEARKLLGRFISGDESDAPQITTAR